MSATTKEQLERILRRVTGLLAKADATTFPEEAKTYRQKAEQLMREYRIAEEDLIASDATSVTPEYLEMEICGRFNTFQGSYETMGYWIFDHCGVMAARGVDWEANKFKFLMVGYAGDLRQAEFLFNAARIVFKNRLEPEVDPELSEAENIYRLRQSGITRWDVAVMMWGKEVGGTHSAHAKVGRIYKEECQKRGEAIALDGRGISLKDFRAAYASNFIWELERRLRQAREGVDVVQGGLELHGRKERVQEAFWTRWPQFRPSADPVPATKAPAKPLKAKARTKKDDEAYYRRYHSPAARAGQTAGIAAAREVEMDRTPRAKRLED